MTLIEYQRKRDLGRSGEPAPREAAPDAGPLLFVVHKHAARRLHYDFRLELDGVLKSWAIPRGFSSDPSQKHLAVMVEDHPLDYRTFEGVIPEGAYGAGQVIIWDQGVYSPDDGGELSFDSRAAASRRMKHGLEQGKVSIFLRGQKLKGSFTLVRIRDGKNWLLMKHRDEYARAGNGLMADARSVLSGLTIEDLKAGRAAPSAAQQPDPAGLPGARKAPFPSSVAPMLASPGGQPFRDPEWVFEPKLDGYRIIALISDGKTRLLTRRGIDATGRYVVLTPDLDAQPGQRMVLDGELLAMDKTGRPSFQCLQEYMETLHLPGCGERAPPLMYYVFDLLYLDGYDLTRSPLLERKKLLAATLRQTSHVRLVEHFPVDGAAVYRAAIDNGLEGVIAKHAQSAYEPGRRSKLWLKIKANLEGDFIIVGWTSGEGAREDAFGSLLLGYYDDKRLVFAGRVGTGFNAQRLADITRRLEKLRTNKSPVKTFAPSRNTVWVRPELVAEIKYRELTADGYLRSPVFVRLREDKPAEQVGPPQPQPRQPDPNAATGEAPDPDIAGRITNAGDSLTLSIAGDRLSLTNLNKELWPSRSGRAAVTKRDLLVYLARIAPVILPHLKDRPLTLTRFPDGIRGESFYQKHWDKPLPPYVETVDLPTDDPDESGQYLACNNLATLLWLGQMASIELHTWYSRIAASPDLARMRTYEALYYPDFMVFDIDPYIYTGKEKPGAEPELSRRAFKQGCQAALWLKDTLDSLGQPSFVKTSGKTGLHVYAPIMRQLDYTSVRAAARTICTYLLQKHPRDLTVEWAVEKRTGKVFLDYNQNVRGKTLASAYSPRPTSHATVSMPLRWDELGKCYPTDFTLFTVPNLVQENGDLWARILEQRVDIKKVLGAGQRQAPL